MLEKVLIANRGAIAVRVIRTLKQMGIHSVAVYAEGDADSLHVSQADSAISLGEGGARETYLNQDKLFDIMQQEQIDAVHPGYGFLSENPDFVERCEAAGIVFIGPTAEQMRVFGLKHTARDIARQNQVPLLPGTDLLLTLDSALEAADRIGYPVMLKSTAGGGGIGMQTCYHPDQLHNAFASVKRLSANNFSNDGVFLEKYIEQARHIEVQIFGDGFGNAIALGERDCSAQRRNQKVIEETPAPNLPDNIRSTLHKVAADLVSAVNYRNAGTVEFIYDQNDQTFYFLEVNTRLQVEHGVTEQVYGVDLVRWMVQLAGAKLPSLKELSVNLKPHGHAVQARIYAENPHRNFQPSAGLLSAVEIPPTDGTQLRIDHWISSGLEVSPFFDPMLAKVITWSETRKDAIAALDRALEHCVIQGIETNIDYVQTVLRTAAFQHGSIHTRYLNDLAYHPATVDVISPGTLTTIQDFPGRVGYWDVGVPPSGPFDCYSFQLGNRLLGNSNLAAGLEITLNGPTLLFNHDAQFIITGAPIEATLDGTGIANWQTISAQAGQTLILGKVDTAGARAYLLVSGGFDGNQYLGSRSTFTLGQFGGFSGRALRSGDVLHLLQPNSTTADPGNKDALKEATPKLDDALKPAISNRWKLHVTYGPHGAPDFFTEKDIQSFFAHTWEVHYNSSRTGVRLIGPKPEWARSSGGEAGMHPSNIHDNAYAIGTVDFTGDMPVILGPDGPSLGGFVCPATVVTADLWKLGQLRAGDTLQFVPVTQHTAKNMELAQQHQISNLEVSAYEPQPASLFELAPIHSRLSEAENGVEVVYRAAGDKYLLVEYGPQKLDVELRFLVHTLMLWLEENKHANPALSALKELTPGIRSLQIHYDSLKLPLDELVQILIAAEQELQHQEDLTVPARIVHIPLSWDDEACRVAIQKYMQSVRKDAPWCPNNIEFIRRINGLNSIEEVKKIVFDAHYLVMGLGDVYLGAPVATPLDPRHRLVTTKYNPARTWTAENSVGIGGSYMCVYGMEGPGGYQFIGRTLQMWNRYRQTAEFTKPWLLRFFDQIKFYEVSADELKQIRQQFPRGQYPLKIEETTFSLKQYQTFLMDNETSIHCFTEQRNQAFETELQHWIDSGQFHFDSTPSGHDQSASEQALGDDCIAIESHVAGSIWQWKVAEGEKISAGQTVCILESMKMEIEVMSSDSGTVQSLCRQQDQQVSAGQPLLILKQE
ncbi:urea carboxylase [Ketobacter alkanivorans]|uniref:Biotin carboxylase n=1 Tax=Ketobacter alkanivorans TaxID=1917421 RepID=A0A2K9LMF4_9GAMM|nr:urea carboxylase [Ketobacter alkanivorans]AUM13420.1 urea carboxylase [Ketobacter alkanivorans]